MGQKNVRIGEVDVPIIVDNGEEWFPVSYLSEKVLLRKGKVVFNKNYLKKFKIDYGFDTGGIQEVNCISKINLKEELKKTRIGWLSVEQRKAQNHLHYYLDLELLPVEEQDTEHYDLKWINELDEYTKDVVTEEMKDNIDWYRRCGNCNLPLPLTSRFFPLDARAEKGFSKICRVCLGRIEFFTHQDKDKHEVRKQGLELFHAMQTDNLLRLFEEYRAGNIKRLPNNYKNKETYLKMIKIHFDRGTIQKGNLTLNYIEELGLKSPFNYLSATEVYQYLFGETFYLRVWEFPKYQFRETEIPLNYELAIRIVKNYIDINKVIIEDIFNYDYSKLFKKCKVANLMNKDIQTSIVKFYDYQYAGYKFKQTAMNYYKSDDNVLFDLKYLIEKDLKIEIDKIPLYITKTVLQRKCLPLYRWIVTHKNGTLYEWVNKLYPDKFIETDFEVNAYRNEFGSDQEMYIDEILRESFNNVIYNQIHTSRTIEIDGKIPDWIVLTNSGALVVEYFGLYEMRQYGKSSRVTDYIDKTHRKIEEYEKIKGYRYLFLYPEDTNDDYSGVRQKIAKMKEI